MRNPRLALALRHLLLEAKFIVLGISGILFLGLPYYKITQILYTDFVTFKQISSLQHEFATTTGTLKKIYPVISVIPHRSKTYVFEFSYLDKQAKTSTTDAKQLTSNRVGDQVLVFYNQHAAMIEHIPPYILPLKTILGLFMAITLLLFLPMLIALIVMVRRIQHVRQVYALHLSGLSLQAEITYFKVLRHNNYLVEYLYQVTPGIRLRQRTIACNYLQLGNKKPGELIDILYDQLHPAITCVNEKNYE